MVFRRRRVNCPKKAGVINLRAFVSFEGTELHFAPGRLGKNDLDLEVFLLDQLFPMPSWC